MNAPSAKSSNHVVIVETTATNAASFPLSSGIRQVGDAAGTQRVADAVYAYLQARRALGVTSVSTSEVATALQLPRRLVEAAVGELTGRGVKVG